jgi:hypothetical protein
MENKKDTRVKKEWHEPKIIDLSIDESEGGPEGIGETPFAAIS